MQLLIFILIFVGLQFILKSFFYTTSSGVVKAISHRGNIVSLNEQIISYISTITSRFVYLDTFKKEQLGKDFKLLNINFTPEIYYARGLTTAFIISSSCLTLIPLSVPLSICLALLMFWIVWKNEVKKLPTQLANRQKAIEKELPHFAGTISQSLNSTIDIIVILSNYKKICGDILKDEINITLNEMKIGNIEKALQNFEARIYSVQLSEITRGLISLYRGENQKVYFELLYSKLTKIQEENVKKEILDRPNKLKINLMLLMLSATLMFFTAILGSLDLSVFF